MDFTDYHALQLVRDLGEMRNRIAQVTLEPPVEILREAWQAYKTLAGSGNRRRYAETYGYFWLPCDICGEYTSGFEWLHVSNSTWPTSVPDFGNWGNSTGICPDCTYAGHGWPTSECYEVWGITFTMDHVAPGVLGILMGDAPE
jgi:hypothetical protein